MGSQLHSMAPMKKATTSKAMTKGAIAEAIAASCELKKSVCAKALNVLAEVATQEVKKTGVFALPGLCRLKTRTKPATKAGSSMRRSSARDKEINAEFEMQRSMPLSGARCKAKKSMPLSGARC